MSDDNFLHHLITKSHPYVEQYIRTLEAEKGGLERQLAAVTEERDELRAEMKTYDEALTPELIDFIYGKENNDE